MPISLSHLTANRKRCVVTFDGVEGALHIEYYPQRLTARMLASLNAADKLSEMPSERVLEVVSSPVSILTTLLATWDLTADDDDGPVLPIDAATLEGLGLPILWQIVAAIMADGSGSGSSAGEASAPEGSAKKRPSGATC